MINKEEAKKWNAYICKLDGDAPGIMGLTMVLASDLIAWDQCVTPGRLRNWMPIFVEFLERLSQLSEPQQEEFLVQWENYCITLNLCDPDYWGPLLNNVIKLSPLGHPHWKNRHIMKDIVWDAQRKAQADRQQLKTDKESYCNT